MPDALDAREKFAENSEAEKAVSRESSQSGHPKRTKAKRMCDVELLSFVSSSIVLGIAKQVAEVVTAQADERESPENYNIKRPKLKSKKNNK